MTTNNQLYRFVSRTKEARTLQKDDVRIRTIKMLFYFFHETGLKTLRFLTLPCAYWIAERKLSYKFEWRDENNPISTYFVGAERDWKLFSLACINLPDKPGEHSAKSLRIVTDERLNCQRVYSKSEKYSILHTDIFKYMEATTATFNCIWLDTTSPITYIAEKLVLIKKVIRPRQPLAVIVTILKGRDLYTPDDRVAMMDSIMRKVDRGLCRISIMEYCDTSPMMQFIYTKEIA